LPPQAVVTGTENSVIVSFTAFFVVSAIVIITPGPDTALTIRNTILGGRAAGLLTALGVGSGQAIWAIAASLGLTALLTTAEPIFLAIKYAGAAYLIFLGAQALRSALFPSTDLRGLGPLSTSTKRLRPAVAYRQGIISNLGNPKMVVFFASLLPQYVDRDTEAFAALLLLGMTFVLMTVSWLGFYVLILAYAGDVMRTSGLRRAIEAATGAVLIGMGLKIVIERE
jgi:threonine/homoserine/homoserine lactone efflux protein